MTYKNEWKMMTGEQFSAFLAHHGLKTLRGYELVGHWLYIDAESVRKLCRRGCTRAYADLILARLGLNLDRKRDHYGRIEAQKSDLGKS